MSLEVAIAGTGNVSSQLVQQLQTSSVKITHVFSRNPENRPAWIGREIQMAGYEQLKSLQLQTLILAVPDRIIPAFSPLVHKETLVIHTSGATSFASFKDNEISNYGCIYPFQTFTQGRALDFSRIPIFFEGNNSNATMQIRALSEGLSERVFFSTYEQRVQLHMSGVIGNNFTNHLIDLSKRLLDQAGFDWKLLQGLMNETVSKAFDLGPHAAQTGPAVRNDRETLSKHLEVLSSEKLTKEVYESLTRSIQSANYD